jgi:hypothetical protein
MSLVQRVAQIFGWVFVLVAIWGFVVSRGSMEADMAEAPKILGLFAVNVLHNLAHLVLGIWGILAARSFAGARGYCRIAGIVYLFLVVLALVDPTTFGLMPIGGADIGLHAALGLVLTAVGFTAKPSGVGAAT